MAKQLTLSGNRVLDSDAAPVPGAVAYLYETGSDTPAIFYADADLTVSLGNSVTANEAGRFSPLPYQSEHVPFRLRIEDAEGVELDDIDPFFFGLQQGVDGAPASIEVGTVTTLAAGSPATVENVGTSYEAVLDFGIPQGAASAQQPVTLEGDVEGTATPPAALDATIANDAVTFAKMQNASGASKLVGRGSASGAGDFQEITLGANLTMTGTVLSAAGGGGGGGFGDGDYGDVVVSGSGTVLTIDSNAVTLTKLQDIGTNKIIGRSTALTGDPEELGVANGVEISGGNVQLANNGVTNAKLRQSAGLSVVGRSANSTGDVADITAANDGEVLVRSGTSIGFGPLNLSTSGALTGNLPVTRLNNGTGASSSTYWRGDGSWASIALGASVTFAASGGAAAGTSFDGSTAKTIDYGTVGAAPAFLKTASSSSNVTLGDNNHNNGILTMSGGTTRTITGNSTPTTGATFIIHNLGSVSMTLSCANGVYKNGATSSATSGSIPAGGVVTVIHKGAGVYIATGNIT